ncbi:hypothetical protein FAF44_33860 [Nonomuraea sp. MG754425]|uniref:hypothetical protein n=1 Tax=Nonomuraea sp. MG754425 TaxID=2570319 RepID=UPI001F3908C7|nr:hypothetical protein [Nonomuraea sp. MG754425]MCF6473333.1 hypothetical protein [Nonomuraea sp. MG754425]
MSGGIQRKWAWPGGAVEAADDFQWVLDIYAPDMRSWQRRIEVDHYGWWWLMDGPRRRGRGRRTWRPADEVDAYTVVALLHTLNGFELRLHPEVHRWAAGQRLIDKDVLRWLNTRAYSLFIRYLLM